MIQKHFRHIQRRRQYHPQPQQRTLLDPRTFGYTKHIHPNCNYGRSTLLTQNYTNAATTNISNNAPTTASWSLGVRTSVKRVRPNVIPSLSSSSSSFIFSLSRQYLRHRTHSTSATISPPTLTLWKKLIQTIPIQRILPTGMMTPLQPYQPLDDSANRAAFYGDKILNYHISQIIRQHQLQSAVLLSDDVMAGNQLVPATSTTATITTCNIDVGFITLVQSEAMSNQLFSNSFTDILGDHPEVTSDMMQLAQQQVHAAGTMVEATVDAIFNQPLEKQDEGPNPATPASTFTKEDAVAAVRELATYLVHKAYATSTYFNAKGQLLELGGTVISFKDKGSVDHAPKYRAIATFRGMSYVSDCPSSSKKRAEQIAATHLLNKCQQIRKRPIQKTRLTFTNNRTNSINIDHSIGDPSSSPTISTTTAVVGSTGDIDVVAFEAYLKDDGTLPDDFSSDSSNIAKTATGLDADEGDEIGRPFDAMRFQLPKLKYRSYHNFHRFNSTHSVNLKNGESPELSWRRGAYEKKSCFHRAVLSSKMLPQHVETVNSWSRINSKGLFTVVVALIPKRKPEDIQKCIFPTVKCFVHHDTSRTRARNAVGLVVNQYIDQDIIGNDVDEIQRSQMYTPRQPDCKLWSPSDVVTTNEIEKKGPKKLKYKERRKLAKMSRTKKSKKKKKRAK